jgi:hypothetical protein
VNSRIQRRLRLGEGRLRYGEKRNPGPFRITKGKGFQLKDFDPSDDVVAARAARGMFDDRAAAAIDNRSDNVGLGFPDELILDFDRLAEEPTKPFQHHRMGRARCARTDHLLGNWQIDAHNPVFEEANPRLSE